MSLRDEILLAPRGTQSDLIRKTGFSKPTIYLALRGLACSADVAHEMASAFGCPDRWHELVVVKSRKRIASHRDLPAAS